MTFSLTSNHSLFVPASRKGQFIQDRFLIFQGATAIISYTAIIFQCATAIIFCTAIIFQCPTANIFYTAIISQCATAIIVYTGGAIIIFFYKMKQFLQQRCRTTRNCRHKALVSISRPDSIKKDSQSARRADRSRQRQARLHTVGLSWPRARGPMASLRASLLCGTQVTRVRIDG